MSLPLPKHLLNHAVFLFWHYIYFFLSPMVVLYSDTQMKYQNNHFNCYVHPVNEKTPNEGGMLCVLGLYIRVFF